MTYWTATWSIRPDGTGVEVTAKADGVRVHAWGVPNTKAGFALVLRLARCIEAGKAFEWTQAITITVDAADGKGYRPCHLPARWMPVIMGRRLNADLKAKGF